ncbi:MAG TPA: nitroreductase family protein, partial [Prolixibacteraceae bacterium]|nr:nitroreductase family protein [Prolixibacteraceae bacterium]
MELVDAIKKRKSCRSFNADVLKISDRAELEKFINEKTLNLFDESLDLKVIGKEQPQKTMKLDYGMIKGHNTYILGKSKATTDSRVNYGYQLEKVVLKATALGLGTCWCGAFDVKAA